MRTKAQRRAALKEAIYRQHNGCCRYCGLPLTRRKATLDHVVPRHLGGTSSRHNLVISCSPCNQKKACKPPHVWHMELMTEKAA